MDGSKCIISNKTDDLVTYKGTKLPVLDGDTVLLYNKQANCVVRAPLTKSIRDIFKIPEQEKIVVEGDYEAVEEDGIIKNQIGQTVKQTEETTTELLIAEYSNRPPLYNERLPIIERSRSIKKALELEVYNALGGKTNISGRHSKKMEFKKQKALLNKYVQSGCSYEETAKVVGKSPWKHFLSMHFIDDHIDERKRVTNIPEPLETSCSSMDIILPPLSPQLQSNAQKAASTPSSSNSSTSGNISF
ncbi:hypothetical protein FQA39_LY03708 [Lamprigera yunnana]|nr:hypothetical protein FQA39_LY03708 [Lamprigera yunnana]